jgi:hypothetical protein
MTNSTDFNPAIRRPKQIKVYFVIDMWGIEGPYGDGDWHELIQQFASEWASQNPAQEPATLWSIVRDCDVFESGKSCYMTSSTKLPKVFFERLHRVMAKHCGSHFAVLDAEPDSPFEANKGWRAYLHFEQGKLWLPDDEGGWCEAAD